MSDSPTFISVPGGTYELGWRFTPLLQGDALAGIREFASDFAIEADALIEAWFSPARSVQLTEFAIAATAVPLRSIAGDSDLAEASSVAAVCDAVDRRLALEGCRLPTEDELEAACGETLFPWGNEIPDGEPHSCGTRFKRHQMPTTGGFLFDGDTYAVELVRSAFKLDDGGSAVCNGSTPWPIAWLSLSPAYRLPPDQVTECLPEYLEGTWICPVLL